MSDTNFNPNSVSAADEGELNYLRRISERNAAKILALDTQSITIRHELEQKRRGFSLLAELSVSLRQRAGYEDVFIPAARRINAALNMQRTIVLTSLEDGRFKPVVLQGYPPEGRELMMSRIIEVDPELLDPERPVLVTGADSQERLAAFRRAVEIPYLISSPAFAYDGTVAAILVTGRMVEETPFLSRLGRNDVETVQAVSALLAAVLVEQHLENDLRRARDLAEKNAAAKSEFLANVSHEVRTPMNAILGMARALTGSEVSEKQRRWVDYIVNSTHVLLRVFDDIMDFSNIDAGRMVLQIAEFSIKKMAESVHSIIAEQIKGKTVDLSVTVDPDVPDAVMGDAIRTEQVILNLGSNAVKFTKTGRIAIHIGRRDLLPDGVKLVFEVEDTGIGMSEEQSEHVFLPFTQVDASHTRKYGGTGLGLPISRSLVELMKGEIWCESRLGEGSKFSFTAEFALPAQDSAGGVSEKPEDEASLEMLQGMRVLLVEDNLVNQLVAGDILSGAGVEFSVAGNGLEALEALEKDEYDLVLMDIQMPEMDGLTATTHIRANPKYKDLPVLAMTAHSLPQDREDSFKSGMNDHITKPVEPERLYSALLQWRKRFQSKKGV